jgi:glycosyltransferase involved in cell wall biosynthesis
MKLLIYSHYFPPSIGGVETVVLALASGLVEQRGVDGSAEFDITLVTQTPAMNFQDALLPFRIIRQPAPGQLVQLIQLADVVHVAGPAFTPILQGLLARKPVVVEHHGFQAICPTGQLFQEPENLPCPGHFMAGRHEFCLRCSTHVNRIASLRLWLLTFLRRFLLKRVAVNITPTAWLAARLQLPRSKTVHHGLKASSPLVRFPSEHATPLVVFVGRLVTTKGVRLLLEASQILLQQRRSIELIIIGDGPERPFLEAFAKECQLTSQVHFLGRVPQLQIPEILAKTNIAVVPSLGGEVFGMVLAENMLRGIPILASDLGAFVEVLGDAGCTFKTGDPVDLAREIARILDDVSLLNRMGHAAHQRVLEFFTMDRMIEGHAQIYRKLASDTRPP